jgi:hypothetical protein
MRVLELFAGTQSFTKTVERLYPDAECVTVDILPKFNPTYLANLATWNYKVLGDPGHFDIIWCSPPCTEYSKAKTRGPRDLEAADQLVRRCAEIIQYFQPRAWIIENVGTGLLPGRMPTLWPEAGTPGYADYCAYGAPYRKRTVFWSNADLSGLRLCGGAGVCESMVENRHRGSVGNARIRYNAAGINSVWQKNAIPPLLCEALLAALLEA